MKKKVIKFYANWCGPCKIYAKTFDKVKEQYSDQLEIEEVNVDTADKALIDKYKVSGIPLTVFEIDDKPVHKVPGNIPEKNLIEKVEELINK